MRYETIEYNCNVRGSKMQLALENWWVGTYPLTYTPQECLEAFCEMAGWEFVSNGNSRHIGQHYLFDCRVPTLRMTGDVIYDFSNHHRNRMAVGAA